MLTNRSTPTQHGSWAAESLETSVFKYTYSQFIALRKAALATSSISLIFSVLIIIVYIFMYIRDKKRANRVSLRCVFLCCIVDTVNAIMNIVITDQRGDTQFCRAAGVIIKFSNIMSAALLTLVGLNLILIFVINVNHRDLLEKFYYPCTLIYTLIGIAVPIYSQVTADTADYDRFSCWYLKYIEDRTFSTMSWMWFYSFIFFVNIIAIICSVTSMIKLLLEQNVSAAKMNTIAAASTFTTKQTDKMLDETVKKRQSTVFTKVVLRCILYPLVPFLVNIFGFILQMVITTTTAHPTFVLAMLDIIFSGIIGFLVAVVFFTEPATTSFLKEVYHSWHQKYVKEYVLITQDEEHNRNPNLPPLSENSSIYTPSILNVKGEDLSLVSQKRKIPMHRVQMSRPSICSSNDSQHRRQLSMESSTPTLAPPPPSASNTRNNKLTPPMFTTKEPTASSAAASREIYIPYTYPRLARIAHCILSCFSTPTYVTKTCSDDVAGSTRRNSSMTDEYDIPNSIGSSTLIVDEEQRLHTRHF